MEDNLKKVPGVKFSGTTYKDIDGLYIEGYISDDHYKQYYMDPTRTFKPTIFPAPPFSGKELEDKGNRMLVVQRKNLMIHNINMATKILDL